MASQQKINKVALSKGDDKLSIGFKAYAHGTSDEAIKKMKRIIKRKLFEKYIVTD